MCKCSCCYVILASFFLFPLGNKQFVIRPYHNLLQAADMCLDVNLVPYVFYLKTHVTLVNAHQVDASKLPRVCWSYPLCLQCNASVSGTAYGEVQ